MKSSAFSKAKSFVLITLLTFLLVGLQTKQAPASHMVGSDITYKCVPGSNGTKYEVILVYYRDCSGIPTCSGNCSTIGSCTKQVDVRGADPTCNGTLFFSFTVTGVSVRDVNPNPRCSNAKMICDNMGCVTPGSLTPGIERYEFRGIVDVGPSSGIPASCCNITFSFQECCRNSAIQNISPANFYTDATVNRCVGFTDPDNCSSPDLTNDPYAVMCTGQGFIFNNGAFDPDLDSLVYSWTASLDNYGVSCTYIAPYSYDIPMPYLPPLAGNYPFGIHVDPLTGDIMFTPQSAGWVGVMAIRIEQWRLINGVYVKVGVTRRDLQVYMKFCTPNNPPTLRTNPAGIPPLKPKTKYEICAGTNLCFDVIAKDTDFNPPTVSDTTYITWNNVMQKYGASFTPNYVFSARQTLGPREDSYKFCWTPSDSACKRGQPTTYPFYIKAVDSRCPYPGIINQQFQVRVLPQASVQIKFPYNQCGKAMVTYVKDASYVPLQTFQGTTWMIAKNPGDNNFSGGAYTYSNIQTTPLITFQKGGNYLVELTVNMLGPNGVGFCSKIFRDTLKIDTPVTPILRDTFVCRYSSVNISATAKFGTPSYRYKWFNSIKDTLSPLNGPLFGNSNLVVSPLSTRYYTLQVYDIDGCTTWDSLRVQIKNLPYGNLIDSTRICYGDTFALDPGNNGGNIRSFLWNTGDTTELIVRKDSNTFVVILTDTFGCKNTDSLKLYVNARINARAGLDTFICKNDTTMLMGTGGTFYTWTNLNSSQVISAKSYTPWVKVNPTNVATPTKYQVRVYQSYPDTTNNVLECSAVDTVIISVKPLPTLTKPTTPTLACAGALVANLNPFGTPIISQSNGKGVWFYSRAANAVVNPNTGPGIGTTPQIKLDSLKNKPSTSDGLAYTNYVSFTYADPTYGCKSTDSVIAIIYGKPPIDAGKPLDRCENLGSYEITLNANQTARGVVYPMNSTNTNQCFWTGAGIDSTFAPSKKYFFNPAKTGVLKMPAKNIIKYTYNQINTYTYPVTSTSFITNCLNSDTTLFSVNPVPLIDAGIDISICKNEPQFVIADKSNASVNPATGNTKWWAKTVSVDKGIVNGAGSRTDFDASLYIYDSTTTKEMLIYKDSNPTTGCWVADTTYLNIIGYPKVAVSFSYPNMDDSTKMACQMSGNIPVWTYINGLPRRGYVDIANSTYSYNERVGSSNTPSSAWHPDPSASGVNSNSFYNTNEPGATAGAHTLAFVYSQTNGVITCKNQDYATLTVEQAPVIALTPGGAMCDYDPSINISSSVTPATYKLTWTVDPSLGTFGDATANSTTFSPLQAAKDAGGAWIFSVSDKPGTCAIDIDSTWIDVQKQPKAGIICPDCEGCEPLTSHLSAMETGVANATFSWQWADGYASNTADSAFVRTIATYGSTGLHTVKLTVQSGQSKGCTNSADGKMVVHAKPQAGFTFDPPYTTVAKPYYTFTNTSSAKDNAAMTYLWEFGSLNGADPSTRLSNELNPKSIEFKEDTTLIKMTVTTEFGCWDTVSHVMVVEPDITVFTPNAFYPNSSVPCPDGNSDCNRHFQIAATGYASVEIFVFNRWGQQVFYSNRADDGGWNGQINNKGAECPQDVYIYQVNATSFNGKLYKYSGSITLLR